MCERGNGAPVEPSSFTRGFARIAEKSGIAGVRLHDCRHGIGSALGANGTPAYVTSKILGQSSVHFTATVYQHADEETIERAFAGLEEAFNS